MTDTDTFTETLKSKLSSITSTRDDLKWRKISEEHLNVDYTILFSNTLADMIMKHLEETIEYYSGELTQVKIFGKYHQIPRLQVAYGDPQVKYKFSGISLTAKLWLPILELLRNVVEKATGFHYNFVLINKYRDGNDHIGEHRDDEKEIDRKTPIASLSFGQQRTFIFKHFQARLKGKLKRDLPRDPRTEDYFLMSSPIPTVIIIALWLKCIFHWGPAFMKDRPPYDLKHIMIFYNIFQIIANAFITYLAWTARKQINWECTPVDYSNSYWGQLFLWSSHKYFLLKIADLLDTIFFVLRKKERHISFLHTYHHFGMVLITWVGAKYVGGGHSYFIGAPNCIVHTILYSYYLLTAYDSRFGKLVWLKKLITQAQLVQFIFILYMFVRVFFTKGCEYPKIVPFFIIPQNMFMIILFGDFYVRTYVLSKRKKKKEIVQE